MDKHQIFKSLYQTKLTKAEALKFYKLKFWENEEWQPVELAYLQFNQERLVMPFDVWWESVDASIDESTTNIFYCVPEIEQQVIEAYDNKIRKPRLQDITKYDPLKKRIE